jgi:hypothetical protein
MPVSSVADPGCLSRIRIFPSWIQGRKDSGSRIRIRINEFKYFNPKLFLGSRKYDPECSSRIHILIFIPIPDPGSRGQKRHRIPDPQHWYHTLSKKEMLNSADICRHSLRREERSAEPRLLMSPPPPPPTSTPLSSGGAKPRSSRLSLSRPAQNRGSSGSVPAAVQSPLQHQETPFQQQQEAPFQQQQEAQATLPDDDFQVSVCV